VPPSQAITMPGALTREQVRAVDAYATEKIGIPSLVLMENAARGCADVLESLGIGGPVAILCGRGNNGGDGLALARHLVVRGFPTRVSLFHYDEALSPDAAANLRWLRETAVDIRQTRPEDVGRLVEDAPWIVDALLGTGAAGDPRPPYDTIIRAANQAVAKKLAIDIPSGLHADTGELGEPTFRADHTCTFVAKKTGMTTSSGQRACGKIHVCDIGVTAEMIHKAIDKT